MKLSRGDQSELKQFLESKDFTQSSHLELNFHPESAQNITSLFHSDLDEVSTQSRDFKTQLHESQFQLNKIQESCIFKEQLIQKLETEIEQLGLELKSPVVQNAILAKTGSSEENNLMQLQSDKDLSDSKTKLQDLIIALTQQNKELELTNRRLIDEKCILEVKVSFRGYLKR